MYGKVDVYNYCTWLEWLYSFVASFNKGTDLSLKINCDKWNQVGNSISVTLPSSLALFNMTAFCSTGLHFQKGHWWCRGTSAYIWSSDSCAWEPSLSQRRPIREGLVSIRNQITSHQNVRLFLIPPFPSREPPLSPDPFFITPTPLLASAYMFFFSNTTHILPVHTLRYSHAFTFTHTQLHTVPTAVRDSAGNQPN